MVPSTHRRAVWACLARNSLKVLSKHAVLPIGGFKLAPGPGILAVLKLPQGGCTAGWE